jgi:DNA gyrase subunit A
MRYPLVDGQGNFGSVDGDSPAAMRYTEARLTRLAEEMLEDIDKETVDFQLNFDDSLKEPTVMPCKFPHLLMNGSAGIAVGMATNMAPHNLSELIDGIHAYIDRRDITCDELLAYVKAPDFPTGGLLYGYEGIRDALLTGRGRVVIRARATVEVLDNGRERIIVTEIPYLVNKADMLQKTGDLVNEKKLEGISEIRDESDRDGMRIVYEIRKDAMASVVLNHLYKYTALQSSFSVNNIALVNGRPQALNLLDLIRHFVDHRHEVVLRRTRYDLAEAQRKAHILEGYLIALDHLDEIISLIRASATPDIAKVGLMSQFGLSEIQSKAILELRLQRLTGMERDKIRQEYNEIMALISRLQAILEDEGLRMSLIKDELTGIKERFGDARRSEIVYSAGDFRMEDMIEEEDVVVTVSHLGYIKRTAAHEYRVQNRGGKGAMGGATRDHDFIEHMLVASTHHWMLFFTEQGRCYWLKVYEIPEGAKNTKGRAVQNLLQIPQDDKIRAYISVRSLDEQEYLDSNYIVFCTRSGVIKKTTLEAYSRPRANGINAININEGDQLLEARLTNGQSEMVMATNTGRAIRFHESKVRPMGRTATGVRGVSLDAASEFVIGMVCVQNPEITLLVVSETGYGKRSGIEDYRVTNRGGKGVRTLNITEKTGALVALQAVDEQDDLMIINKSGVTIRIGVESLRVMGRATQGVRLIKLHGDDRIASVALVQKDEHEHLESQTNDDQVEPNENPDPTNLS